MALPLSDIRVVDFSQGFAGPCGTMFLADQGAEVIKIETPESASSGGDISNLVYLSFNRNKRSIVLDITKAKGRELFDSMLRWADVFVINMRVGPRQRKDLTYEDVAAINPRLIYASLTAYGEAGPEADLPGIDIVTQSRVGDTAGRRAPGDPPPLHSLLCHYDMATSMLIFGAVMLALRGRERTGQGQKVEVNLVQTALALQAVQMTRMGGSDEGFAIRPTGVPAIYLCRDGRYIFVSSGGTRWDGFCRSVGLDDLAADPRFDTNEKREQQVEVLTEIFSHHFSTRPAAEWEAMLKADGNMVSMVKELSEVYDDPQVVANEMITQFDQPGIGLVKAVNTPFKLSGSADEPHIRRPVPEKGEHTFEVLREMGHSPEEVEALKAEGVLG